MNTKIIIAATVAAFSLATTAFAGEGNGDPFPYHTPGVTVQVPGTANMGAAQYATANQASGRLWQDTLPENGQNGPVESANSVPVGAMEGTVAYMQAQSVNRWFAQQAEHRFAQAHQLHTNG